ncbi:MAG: hypothetical protein R2685_01130 [Candidatus Nitrosocosmicus sp.]|nr:hypothetical protein [Candidatus Nitrosocosmicus sp.]
MNQKHLFLTLSIVIGAGLFLSLTIISTQTSWQQIFAQKDLDKKFSAESEIVEL